MKLRLAPVLLAATIAPALAQSGPNESMQRQACMGDAVRLCGAYIPDRNRIRDCMAAQVDQLSPSCRAVFDASVQAERSPSPRR
ncbi:hypothetical protein CI1B_44680 [Bradyrhizobium ivorense]|uniref:Cysteine rich repeat protein n=1 Tax=Bradyrhizobium ivorense TaxID=2511166 RepID=A0A508TEN2_9BRAD|nr:MULTISPECIES: hypothetical protein [Bradyrhizobium]MCC8935022.1 hypothetical protein [Bradyrhizobium ivorense]VIO67195.1 hypothetical protein CI41S_05570 [Bradyrhizobium ivorense]VIO72820.1 hypothetical protein CI1B_44680 [Bradyrhizobium ivorense]